jgi:hypothetical protein
MKVQVDTSDMKNDKFKDLIQNIEQFANQRVIEELEIIISRLDSPWDRDDVRRRINELKQE